MLKKIYTAFKKLLQSPDAITYMRGELQKLDELRIQNGKISTQINRGNTKNIIENIQLAEFRVFSQWGDDGIIQFLVEYLKIESKTFIEFGVEDYKESNTRFLLINNNWKGLIMDCSEKYMEQVQKEDIYWKHDLTALPVFVTKENINPLLQNNGFEGETGLLHIDIDGNDYWIWKEINCIKPVIVIMEFNSVFGFDNPWTIPYDKDFFRTNYHYSNLCYGASLLSLCDLAEEKGYAFVGSNSYGSNAYFVRKDKMNGLKSLTAKEGYVQSTVRESRDKDGKLTLLSGAKRLAQIKGLQIYNTRTQQLEKI